MLENQLFARAPKGVIDIGCAELASRIGPGSSLSANWRIGVNEEPKQMAVGLGSSHPLGYSRQLKKLHIWKLARDNLNLV